MAKMKIISLTESASDQGGFIVRYSVAGLEQTPYHHFDGYKGQLTDQIKPLVDQWLKKEKPFRTKDEAAEDEEDVRREIRKKKDAKVDEVKKRRKDARTALVKALTDGDFEAAADILIK